MVIHSQVYHKCFDVFDIFAQAIVRASSISNSWNLLCLLDELVLEFLLWFGFLSSLIWNLIWQSRLLRFFEKKFWKMKFFVGVCFIILLEFEVVSSKLRLATDKTLDSCYREGSCTCFNCFHYLGIYD